MPRIGQQQVDQMDAGHMFVEDVRDAMVANRRMARRFQTLHYPCPHVVAAYAKVSLNVEQFIDEVYTLKCTLRVWENEFPVLLNLSTLEVTPTTFDLVLDKGLRKNPKGCPQSSRIHNDMYIREKFDWKLCGLCRLASHNRRKCPLRNYHIRQSYGPGGVEYDGGYRPEGVDTAVDTGRKERSTKIQGTIRLRYRPQSVIPHRNIFFMYFFPIMYILPPPVHLMDLAQSYWQCRDILYAIELPEYSIAMIPLHYLKIDNRCANAP
ncbi:hypothetical protein PVK06_002949 [Gossypium arboreum]|uniref:Uncharacterized protein n=1 Tax=Gossypium arboreum TaxID=29729 RepID=A0ABR0R696_GOSAR|nr:hypothetical protein PVK06_002949 [Gossypium arboreum]